VIVHGKEVEHCVTKLENADSERITLVMSLVDIGTALNVKISEIKDMLISTPRPPKI
jgi:hypothetical protein